MICCYRRTLLWHAKALGAWHSHVRSLVNTRKDNLGCLSVPSTNAYSRCVMSSYTGKRLLCIPEFKAVLGTCTSCDYSTTVLEKLKERAYKLGVVMPSKYNTKELQNAAYVLLNSTYMKVQHGKLREHGGLEDSFNMWVIVVYLHVWCLVVRLKQEGRDGEILSSTITKLLWQDIEERLKKFQEEVQQNLKVNSKMRQHYNALKVLFTYMDEGLLGTDAQLASSLWAVMYLANSYDAEAWHLEAMVHYIRYTVARVDKLSMDTLVLSPESVDWPVPPEFT